MTASTIFEDIGGGESVDNATLIRLLDSVTSIDETGAKARCATMWSRSIKNESQLAALDAIVTMTDLTTLEGADTAGRVRRLCAKAVRPQYDDEACPAVAAICVYPDMVANAREFLDSTDSGRGVAVASVATAFPSGRAPLSVKLADVEAALTAGASEIDMVIDRGAYLSGDYTKVLDEVRAVKAVCGDTHLKVILETGELGRADAMSKAAWLAMLGGGDFVKTSTGKVSEGATPLSVYTLLVAVREYRRLTGNIIGVKAAGGIKTAKDAVRFLVLVNETVGSDWLTPALFRFGASSLLDDVLAQRKHLQTGLYWGPDYFPAS